MHRLFGRDFGRDTVREVAIAGPPNKDAAASCDEELKSHDSAKMEAGKVPFEEAERAVPLHVDGSTSEYADG